MTTLTVAGTLAYIEFLHHTNSVLPALNGVMIVISLATQILMLLQHREQWVLWTLTNILTILLWAVMWLKQDETNLPLLLMYCMHLCDSTYRYTN